MPNVSRFFTLLLAAVAFVTLAPIGLRPNSGFSPNIERFAAFAALGFAFALAHPRRQALIVIVVIGAAIALELLQALVASRHARLGDTAFKVIGGGLGLFLGVTITSLSNRYRTRSN